VQLSVLSGKKPNFVSQLKNSGRNFQLNVQISGFLYFCTKFIMYKRALDNIIADWANNHREVVILYGARQTGKSTLLEMLLAKNMDILILNCENPMVADILSERNLSKIRALFENHRIIALDEAQVVPEIGSILKLIYDDRETDVQLIVTGSSSFELSNRTGEPLTGRNIAFRLYPLSLDEIKMSKGWLSTLEKLDELLIFGSYPGIVDLPENEKRQKLLTLSSDYLFKDIFKFESLKNPGLLRKMLKAIALQVGNLVSVNELSQLLGVSNLSVERYLDLLEKAFVIFSIGSYSSNLRNELKKSRKYYFYDNGIRNAVLNNFAKPNDRSDIGALWENFCISERVKSLEYKQDYVNTYFWRTYDGAEIDLVEEKDGVFNTWEFKWSANKTAKLPEGFSTKYNTRQFTVINPGNIHLLLES
jgi:predicted AAA+ superfamily ATPase